jgi:opacity protein-like surface antigen
LVDNWNNSSNTVASDYWAIAITPLLKQTELNLSAGYKPLKWVRIFAGLGVWNVKYKNKESLVLYDETIPPGFEDLNRSYNQKNRFSYGIQESYLPWVLTRQLGISFEIKRNFSLDIAYDRNLTPVSKEIKYKDGNYVFKQRSDRFVVSLGYRFYQLKFK